MKFWSSLLLLTACLWSTASTAVKAQPQDCLSRVGHFLFDLENRDFGKNENRKLKETRKPRSPPELLFKQGLAQSGLQDWQTRLLIKLWEKETAEGYRFVDLRPTDALLSQYHGTKRQAPLPYFLKLPRELVNGLISVAKAKGLKPARRYVVIPGKLLATHAIRGSYDHAYVILALGGSDILLDQLGVLVPDPLLSETDPAGLKKDEVILLVKTFSGKEPKDNASRVGSNLMNELKSEMPDRFILLDLSKDNPQNWNAAIAHARHEIEDQGRKIRKIIISSHGSPGTLYGDKMEPTSLTDFAETLQSFKGDLAAQPEVHFDGCELALTEAGKKEVRGFADRLLPADGRVKANTLFGIAASPLERSIKKLNPLGKYPAVETNLTSTVAAPIGLFVPAFGALASSTFPLIFNYFDQATSSEKGGSLHWYPVQRKYEYIVK